MFIKNDKKENRRLLKKILYDLFIIVISVSVLYFALAVYAGSLVPPGPAGSTMMSLEDIYNALAGTYNSSAAEAKEDGNVMEILKCITNKINGDVCI